MKMQRMIVNRANLRRVFPFKQQTILTSQRWTNKLDSEAWSVNIANKNIILEVFALEVSGRISLWPVKPMAH